LLDVLAIGVNAIVGSGVFSMPDDMHRAMGGFSPLAYVLCAVLLMPVALCFAELAAHNDATGGPYLYATKAFGPAIGFVVGWSAWLNSFISWAANTTLFVQLVGVTSPVVAKLVVVGTIAILGLVNYVGVRPGALVIQAVVAGKLLAIGCFLAVAALFAAHPGHVGGALPHGLAGVGNGVYLALFPFQGFEVVPVPAGETKNPERNMPIGTIGSLLFAAVLYVGVQSAIELAYPHLDREGITPLVDAAKYIGPRIGLVVLIGSIVSIGGFTAGSALGSPRYAEAIAAEGQLPRHLAATHARFRTPYVAIAVTTIAAAALGAASDYRQLVNFSNVTIVFQYALSCVAVLVLRRAARRAGEPDGRGFRVPGGPILPIVGAIGSIALLRGSDLNEFVYAAIGIALGVPVAIVSNRLFRAKPNGAA
jgi:amino acid transporter